MHKLLNSKHLKEENFHILPINIVRDWYSTKFMNAIISYKFSLKTLHSHKIKLEMRGSVVKSMVLSLLLLLGIKKIKILISCRKGSWRSNINEDGKQQNEISWSGSIYYTVEKCNFCVFVLFLL